MFCLGKGKRTNSIVLFFLKKVGKTKIQLIISWMSDLAEIRMLYVSL